MRVIAGQETFRRNPDGAPLATVLADARMQAGSRQGRWVEVTLEGWIWSASVAATDRAGHDLVVTAVGGENLRSAPGDRIVARLLRGLLLDRVEDAGRWIRVRRRGWMWGPSLGPVTSAGAGAPAPPPAAERGEPPASPARVDRLVTGSAPVSLRIAPGGDTVARVSPGTRLAVVERRDRWARVRLEGWVPTSELATPDSAEVVTDLSAAVLRANPEQFQGVRVRWTVQFIALEQADAIRTDFYEGEPYVLARAPDPAEGFVYLAVPPSLLPDVEAIEALESVDVMARVRTGRSALMGVPVLDLLAIY